MRDRGYFALGLQQPKCRENVGEVLRAAGCHGAAMVAVSGRRFGPSKTDTMKAWRHLPFLQADDLLSVVPFGCQTVAVEIDPRATSLLDFVHPERAFYLFGPEDGSLPADIIARCAHVVCIPTRQCMNLAATAQVVLYDRMAKRRSISTWRAA